MKIEIDNELMEILKKIASENKKKDEWCALESSDLFQTEHYCGGYDATENAFCFSYYNEMGKEFWFQFSLNELEKFIKFEKKYLLMRPAG
ncbi:MAG: hypothetical protein ACRCYP_05110 [Alphaproteobacteria bacterium]